MDVRTLSIASRTYRHVNRYRQILSVLVKYGFGGLVDRLKISQYLELGLEIVTRRRRKHVETLSAAERVRMALEELGPTFIKLGQVLSTRPDLVPPEFVVELSRLQRDVPPFPLEKARETIESELGRPLKDVYERFDEKPLAAASIAQVHRAWLPGGEAVVVKVQRPGIQEMVEVDLEILDHLAALAEKHLEDLRSYRPRRIVQEFSRVLEREMDFTVEASHVERFANNFRDDDTVRLPKVHRELTARRVLTMEYVDVTPVRDNATLIQAGFDPKEIARRGAEATLKQIFVHGFFHADPHPGNVFVLPGNVICLLDLGMVGRLDRHSRECFADLIHAVAVRDAARTTTALLRLTTHDDTTELDLRRIEIDVDEFIDLNVTPVLGDMDFGRLLRELLKLVQRHRLFIPTDMVLMMKAAATAERLVSQLDPDINLVAAAEPYVRQLKIARFGPRRVMRDMLESGGELVHLAREIPGGLRDLLRLAKRGGLRIGFEHRGLENLLETHERVANRVSFAIVVAALIVGSSLIVQSGIPPTWNEIPVIGLVGYLAAGAMGFILLAAMIRHGRI